MAQDVRTNVHWICIHWPDSLPRDLNETATDVEWRTRDSEQGPLICLEHFYRRHARPALRLQRLTEGLGPKKLDLSMFSKPTMMVSQPIADRLASDMDRQRQGGEPGDHATALSAAFFTTPVETLSATMNDILTDCPELVGGSAFAVLLDENLCYSQVSAARILARAGLDPDFAQKVKTDQLALGGGRGLQSNDWLGGRIYLLPALAAICPAWLGFVVAREDGCVVFLYPSPLRESEYPRFTLRKAQQAHLFANARGSSLIPEVSRADAEGFLSWWAECWNRLLGELSDPSTHSDKDGCFDPVLMFGRFVTLDRLLTVTHTILTETNENEFIRVALMFDAYDLHHDFHWGQGRQERLFNPREAERDLEKVRGSLAGRADVQRIVMPRCERAVAALVHLREGFRHPGLPDDDKSLDDKVRSLMWSLRNAGHGFGKNPDSRSQLETLVSHPDELPPDLADLAWFQLIRLMCFGRWRRASSRAAKS